MKIPLDVFGKSVITFGWTTLGHRIILAALWLFYRTINLVGVSGLNAKLANYDEEVALAVAAFAEAEDRIVVHNFGFTDGRVYTVMITQVRGFGEPVTKAHV